LFTPTESVNEDGEDPSRYYESGKENILMALAISALDIGTNKSRPPKAAGIAAIRKGVKELGLSTGALWQSMLSNNMVLNHAHELRLDKYEFQTALAAGLSAMLKTNLGVQPEQPKAVVKYSAADVVHIKDSDYEAVRQGKAEPGMFMVVTPAEQETNDAFKAKFGVERWDTTRLNRVDLQKITANTGIKFMQESVFDRFDKLSLEEQLRILEHVDGEKLTEAWSKKYKDSINCSNPKGFSQKAHCDGKKKINEDDVLGRRLFKRGAYKAALDALSKVLARKTEPRKHSVEYYAARIAQSYPGVDTKELVKMHNDLVNETSESIHVDENLRKWFKDKWVRFGPDGKIKGDCAREKDSEGKPKCLPQSKAHSLGKKGRASAARRKRREDPNPERKGAAKNVATKKEGLNESFMQVSRINRVLKKHGFELYNDNMQGDHDNSVIRAEWHHPSGRKISTFTPNVGGGLLGNTYPSTYISVKLHGNGGMDEYKESTAKFLPTSPRELNRYLSSNNSRKNEDTNIPFNVCPSCGGDIVHESQLQEKQDACYHKVKRRYKVWPSAYASGALVQCRKKGAKNWGNSKKEGVEEDYGRYYCSTDKKWKTRQGPKQKRKVKEGAVPNNRKIRILNKIMSEPLLASDIGAQMEAFFAIPDPLMVNEFRKQRAMAGDDVDLRPVVKGFINHVLHPDLQKSININESVVVEAKGIMGRVAGDKFVKGEKQLEFQGVTVYPEDSQQFESPEMRDAAIAEFEKQTGAKIEWTNVPNKGTLAFAVATLTDPLNNDKPTYWGRHFKAKMVDMMGAWGNAQVPAGWKLQKAGALKLDIGIDPQHLIKSEKLHSSIDDIIATVGANSQGHQMQGELIGGLEQIKNKQNPVFEGDIQHLPALRDYFGEIMGPCALMAGMVKGQAEDANRDLLKGAGWDKCQVFWPQSMNYALVDSVFIGPNGEEVGVSSKGGKGARASAKNIADAIKKAPPKMIKKYQMTVEIIKIVDETPAIEAPFRLAELAQILPTGLEKEVKGYIKSGKTDYVGLSNDAKELFNYGTPRQDVPGFNTGYALLALLAKKVAAAVNQAPAFSEGCIAFLNQSSIVQLYCKMGKSGKDARVTGWDAVYPPNFQGRVVLDGSKNYYSSRIGGKFAFGFV
jgi:hypothetical protein